MSLLNELIDFRNIHLAYERVKNGAINRELHNYYEQELFKKSIPNIYSNVQKELKNPDDYKFNPIEILKQPKKYISGAWKIRELARMEFYDQIIAQCVTNIISKYIRTLLPIENYGYKLTKEKSNFMYEQWFRSYRKFVNKEIETIDNEKYQYKYVCETDIENFYPTINHEKLKVDLYNYIENMDDSEILEKWIEKILEIPLAYIEGSKIIYKKSKGLPQGVLYSPILALFYIRDSFARIKSKFPDILCFAYVDDFRFYCESKADGENIKKEFIKYLDEKELKVNKEKTYVKKINRIKKEEVYIMGKASNLDRAIKNEILISSDSRKKMKENLKQLIAELVELENMENKEKLKSFRQRLRKFSDYRLIKLIDSTEEWNEVKNEWENHIDNDDYETLFSSNFVANLHSLFLGAKTIRDKIAFLEFLMKMYKLEDIEYLTYIKYILLQYIFNFISIA